MSNININFNNRTIEMSKKFAAAAKRFGSEAYKELQEARRDYPTFRVVTKSAKAGKRDTYKGLTYAFMENYIKGHDDENGAIMKEFNSLRATTEEAKAVGAAALSYGDIKAWFLAKYPEFAAFQKKREEILAA